LLAGGGTAVVVSGSVDEPDERDVDGVRGWWRHLRWDGEPSSAPDVVARLLDLRLPHHLALAAGDHTEALHELLVRIGGRVVPPARTRDALMPDAAPATT
jgi:hypothetical protein